MLTISINEVDGKSANLVQGIKAELLKNEMKNRMDSPVLRERLKKRVFLYEDPVFKYLSYVSQKKISELAVLSIAAGLEVNEEGNYNISQLVYLLANAYPQQFEYVTILETATFDVQGIQLRNKLKNQTIYLIKESNMLMDVWLITTDVFHQVRANQRNRELLKPHFYTNINQKKNPIRYHKALDNLPYISNTNAIILEDYQDTSQSLFDNLVDLYDFFKSTSKHILFSYEILALAEEEGKRVDLKGLQFQNIFLMNKQIDLLSYDGFYLEQHKNDIIRVLSDTDLTYGSKHFDYFSLINLYLNILKIQLDLFVREEINTEFDKIDTFITLSEVHFDMNDLPLFEKKEVEWILKKYEIFKELFDLKLDDDINSIYIDSLVRYLAKQIQISSDDNLRMFFLDKLFETVDQAEGENIDLQYFLRYRNILDRILESNESISLHMKALKWTYLFSIRYPENYQDLYLLSSDSLLNKFILSLDSETLYFLSKVSFFKPFTKFKPELVYQSA